MKNPTALLSQGLAGLPLSTRLIRIFCFLFAISLFAGSAYGQCNMPPAPCVGDPNASVIEKVLGNPMRCDMGIRIEPVGSGCYTTGQGFNICISVDNEMDPKYFSWCSENPINRIVVKGGMNAMVYTYNPPAFSDSGCLYAPGDCGSGGQSQCGVSHIDFCFDMLVPVELAYFDANLYEDEVMLDWATVSETDNQGFEIQKWVDLTNHDWETIGYLPGHGTTFDLQTYKFLDPSVEAGTNYYRLKQIDLDGRVQYSETRSIQIASKEMSLHLYPNPVFSETISYDLHPLSEQASNIRILLFNTQGQLVRQKIHSPDSQQEMSLSGLPTGLYLAQFWVNGQKVADQKIIKS